MIGASASTMRKLPLKLNRNWKEKREELATSHRRFHSVSMSSVKIKSNILEFTQEKLFHVRLFEMFDCSVAHKSLGNLLNLMPFIEKVIVDHCIIADCAIAHCEPFSLPTLETLAVVGELTILEHFIQCNTQVGELMVHNNRIDDSEATILGNFLSNQMNLTTLVLNVNGQAYRTLGECKHNIKYHLKKLSVGFVYWGRDSSADDAFIMFLASQEATLSHLEISGNLCEKIFVFLMRNMKLTRLIINGYALPLRPMVYNVISPNRHQERLCISMVSIVLSLVESSKSIQTSLSSSYPDGTHWLLSTFST